MQDIHNEHTKLEFKKLPTRREEYLAVLSLHRPQAANAFNAAMIDEIRNQLSFIVQSSSVCRALVLRGSGRNFCAGADLTWMKDSVELSRAENIAEAENLRGMFESLYQLPIPTIAVVQGAVYGGAVGLVAACDMAIAVNDAKFCMSEVRVGLIPAVISPYVARKLTAGQMRRHMLSGRMFKAEEALQYGLVERVCAPNEVNAVVREELQQWLAGSPEAQARMKSLYVSLTNGNFVSNKQTAEAIAEIRAGKSAQVGIRSFLNKQSPEWVCELTDGWSIDN